MTTSFMDHLLRNKVITEDLARRATEWKKQNEQDKRTYCEILETEFGISRDVLHLQVALFYAFRIIDSSERGLRRLIVADAKKLMLALPENVRQLATRHKVLPYDIAENQPDKIVLVTPNPSDREISLIARSFPFKRFEICYMKERDWADYWRQVMLEKEQPAVKMAAPEMPVVEEDGELESAIDRDINRSQLAAMVENALIESVKSGATDIHVVPHGSRRTDIFFRIGGILKLWFSIDDARPEAVVAALKARSDNADRYERFAFQEGMIQKVIDNCPVRFKVFIVPVVARGLKSKLESVSIRILRDEYGLPGIDKLGLDPYTLDALTDAIKRSSGLILLAGADGRGMSDFMSSAFRSAMQPSLSAVTIEDPVHCVIDGARQLKINHKLQLDDALKGVREIDPDILMIGDMRDRFTADIAMKLSVAGCLSLSSIAARTSLDALAFVFAMGVEPVAIAQGLNLVVARRFVRTLCPECKKPIEKADERLLTMLGIGPDVATSATLYAPGECVNCQGGYRGRTALYEALVITPEIRDIIMWSKDRLDLNAIAEAGMRNGMVRLKDTCAKLLFQGVITAEDAVRLGL